MQTRKLTRPREAVELLEPHEPASTPLIATILERGLGRDVHCWLVEGPRGRPAGLIVVFRLCLDRWLARPLVIDPSAAAALADLADRSPAQSVDGPAEHVDPLVPFLRRAAARMPADLLWLPEGAFAPAHAGDPRVRGAELEDLAELVGLYERYELRTLPVAELPAMLRETLERRMALVAELDGRLAGAFRLVAWSTRWAMWDELTVLPQARREGLAWALVHCSARETAHMGRRWLTVRHPVNPMAFPDELGAESSEWALVVLGPHRQRTARDSVDRPAWRFPAASSATVEKR